jgi:hypothetical protein
LNPPLLQRLIKTRQKLHADKPRAMQQRELLADFDDLRLHKAR